MNTEPPYRVDLINAAMGAQRMSNDSARKESGRRNDDGLENPQWLYTSGICDSQKRVVEALGLTMAEISTPKAI